MKKPVVKALLLLLLLLLFSFLAASHSSSSNKNNIVDVMKQRRLESGLDIHVTRSKPPDCNGAVGRHSVIAVVNAHVEALHKYDDDTNSNNDDNDDKSAVVIFGPTPLTTLFAPLVSESISASATTTTTKTKLFDPKIVFDMKQDRFVIVVLFRLDLDSKTSTASATSSSSSLIDSKIFVAASKTGNPTTATPVDWNLLAIPTKQTYNNNAITALAKFPGLAVDDMDNDDNEDTNDNNGAIYITCNMNDVTTGALVKSLLWVIPKKNVYYGDSSVTSTELWKVYDYIAELNNMDMDSKHHHQSYQYGTHMPSIVRGRGGGGGGGETTNLVAGRRTTTTTTSTTTTMYLVMYDGLTIEGTKNIQIVQIRSIPSNSNDENKLSFRGALVPIHDMDDDDDVDDDTDHSLPGAPQPGTDRLIDTRDRRALGAVWVKTSSSSSSSSSSLWMVFTVKRKKSQEISDAVVAAYWIKFHVKNDDLVWPPTLADHGAISVTDSSSSSTPAESEPLFTYFPSMDVNTNGIAAFGFSASSSTFPNYASVYATLRNDHSDAPGTVPTPQLIMAGRAPYYISEEKKNNKTPKNRWGDYSTTTIDPVDQDCFWVFHQYAGANNYTTDNGQFGEWKTAWVQLCYDNNNNNVIVDSSRNPLQQAMSTGSVATSL